MKAKGRTMTDEELRIIEERCNAASPGPWVPKHVKTVYLASGQVEHEVRSKATGTTVAGIIAGRDAPASDLEFIAGAREDVPALIAEVRRLRVRVRDLERAPPYPVR